MKNTFIQAIEAACDCQCPVCGEKPDYKPVGLTGYTLVSCGHREIEKLVSDRLQQLVGNRNGG